MRLENPQEYLALTKNGNTDMKIIIECQREESLQEYFKIRLSK